MDKDDVDVAYLLKFPDIKDDITDSLSRLNDIFTDEKSQKAINDLRVMINIIEQQLNYIDLPALRKQTFISLNSSNMS